MNWYNDNDPKVCAWLRELIADGLIPPGDVDERSITDVKGEELGKYRQCHFFAGIGGWAYAFELAGWPDDLPVWIGSCPCQPFSVAGKRRGTKDERHLWPEFYRLIKMCRPPILFGEQVASKLARCEWLPGVYADLEAIGYRIPKDEDGNWEDYELPACCVGAPHIRQRLYWVAYSCRMRFSKYAQCDGEKISDTSNGDTYRNDADGCVKYGRVANSASGNSGDGELQRGREHGQRPQDDETCRMEVAESERRRGRGSGNDAGNSLQIQTPGPVDAFGLADSFDSGSQRGICRREDSKRENLNGYAGCDRATGYRVGDNWNGPVRWHQCRDGKFRRVPIEPAFFPLANGLQPGRVGILRGAGNAIVPQLAAEFIQAAREAIGDR